jgi:Zn-dependent M16 (insulinase) family peptidase
MSKTNDPSGYKLISIDDLDEYRGRGYLFEHIKTACQIYHVHNDDEENLFSFNFRTPPSDSSGVAHILEHSVLCGSKKFPVKDPFLSMMKGSVNTFLNAMTYPDKTLYPAASVLEKDFFNLMDVYGDAVFFPNLNEEVFRQEGHRLEWDDQGNLVRTGIVYNEMKGNYSSQEGIASEWSIRSLFPDNPYGVDSGGEPESIPTLSYEQFVNFHKTWYHPSNCKIFLYGNIPSEKILTFLDDRFLSEFDKKQIDSSVAVQKTWSASRTLEKTWPLGEGDSSEGKSTISMNWKIFAADDPVRSLSMSILTEMLMGNAGAPLYKALLESGLGEDLSPVSGVDFDLNEAVFTVALRGTDPSKAESFRDLVFATLTELSQAGFDDVLKESCMRLVEFRAREMKGGGPFGIRLLRKIMKGWNYDRNPGASLRFAPVMEEVREKAKTKGYFESILKQWILENPHWTLVTVKPDTQMAKKQEAALKEELKTLQDSMSREERKILDEKNESLKIFQESEDEGGVPFLHRSDIPVKVNSLAYESSELGPARLLKQGVFTNGILYNDMAFSLSHLDENLYPFLPLFTKLLSGTGLPGVGYEVITRDLSMKTGGFGVSVEAGHKVGDGALDKPESFLYIRLKMLEGQRQEALDLALSLLLHADFDNHTRLEQILVELWNDLKSSLIPGGHSYVILRSNSRFSSSALLEDRMFGIAQLQFLESLVGQKHRIAELASLMKEIRSQIFALSNLTLSLTMDDSVLDESGSVMAEFWKNNLPSKPSGESIGSSLPRDLALSTPAVPLSQAEGLGIPASVGFVGKALRGASLQDKKASSQILLSHLLKTGPLWEKIRMKGGAYGAFSLHSGLDQVFTFATYRDPEVENSLDAFKESLQEFSEFQDEGELEKSLISVVGKEMKPQSPSEKSIIVLKRHLYQISDELRQKKRDDLMNCRASDLQEACRDLLDHWEEDSVTVMSHSDKLDKASARWPGLKEFRIDLPQ